MMARCSRGVLKTWGVAVVVVLMMMGYVVGMQTVEVANQDNDVSDKGEGVSLLWGIADTTASVGRLFRYHIPSDAFKGHVDTYEVVEAGKDTLPSWLHFTTGQNVLQGIPTPADAGQLYLEVTARGNHAHKATDVFSLTVSPDTAAMSSGQPLKFKKSGPEVVRCKREEPETVATIVLDADLGRMPVEQRLALLTRFLAHMGLREEMVKIVPASGKLLQDDTALVTGTGDVSEPQFAGVSVSWLVGCGKVESGHFPVLQKLDDDSHNGAMYKAVGLPVAGWRVTNTRLTQQAHKRRRRQVRATATPVVTITPPTATDPGEEVTDADTMTRMVVDMSSPTFTIDPSPMQPEMPKTTTPRMPPTTTTPKEKPDELQPTRRPPDVLPDTSKTDALPTTTQKPMKKTTKKPMVPPTECVRPTVNKKLEKQTYFVGEIVNFKIPEDLFNACDMGGTSETKLSLFINNNTLIPPSWFLQFDQRTQTLRGMPMEGDVETYTLCLVSMLKDQDFITRYHFKVHVRKPRGRKARVSHEMSMTIDTDYDEFMASLDNKLDLANKVAGVFGDKDASALTVTRMERGSLVYAFTNNTMTGGSCPVDDITALADKLFSPDGSISPEALEKLKPWVLNGAATKPAGACKGNPDFPIREASVAKPLDMTTKAMPDETKKPDTPKPDMPDQTSKPKPTTTSPNGTGVATAGKSGGGNIWITTVVPAVVIVAILLVALLVACILYRKKRKGKMNVEEQNTFVNKGAPVIFPDELDEKPSDSSKPLLIEGSPPAPPPEYHRGDSETSDLGNNKEATPPTDEVDAEIEIDATSPLYQPPPPVPANSGKQARPPVQQPYRSQPPEINP